MRVVVKGSVGGGEDYGQIAPRGGAHRGGVSANVFTARTVRIAMTKAVAILLLAFPWIATGRVHAVRQAPAARILWIGAHPDDETLVAPILGPACARQNAVCTLLVFTRGERGGCAIPSGCGPDLGSVRAA